MKVKRFRLISFVVFALVLVAIVCVRVSLVNKAPIEVDEPVNLSVSQSILQYGYPSVKPEYLETPEPYLFHPTLAYSLEALWMKLVGGSDLLSGRLLSIYFAFIAAYLSFFFMLERKNIVAAISVVVFLGFDAWLVLTNVMNYIENTQIVLILIGIWSYWLACDKGKIWMFIMSGLLLGFGIIYKQIGVFLILVVIANWVISKKHFKQHILLLLVMAVSVEIYAIVMASVYGAPFFHQILIQITRVFGLRESRGLTYGLMLALEALTTRYWIYITTISTLLFGGGYVVFKYLKSLVKKVVPRNTVLLSWAFGGLLFAGLCSLKSPHYLILWLYPLYFYLAAELSDYLGKTKLKLIYPVLIAFVALNIFTMYQRFNVMAKEDVVALSTSYVSRNISEDSIIVTEPYIGLLVPQRYLRVDKNQNLEWVGRGVEASYLVLYYSTTVPIEGSFAGYKDFCTVEKEYIGFKDGVIICRLNNFYLSKYVTEKGGV